MRKINKLDMLRLVFVLVLVAGIGLAFGAVGRFVPTHKIVQPVYCGSCHPEQVQELSATTHLGKFSSELYDFTTKYANHGKVTESAYSNARIVSGACVMCHNYWENMKWYGVRNFNFEEYDGDIPYIGDLPAGKDIYGNLVSPYGLGSTKQYAMNITNIEGISSEPWVAGLDVYKYSDPQGNHTRLDYVWSRLSSVSPGPVGFVLYNYTTNARESCGGGTVEHGMCHIAASSVALAYTDQKYEVSDYPNNINGSSGNITTPFGSVQTGQMAGTSGAGVFFTHEMAFTTAQYAAKPVKICGACHIMKLPPMQWGGEPWSVSDMKVVSKYGALNGTDIAGIVDGNTEPFGFRPEYNGLTGTAGNNMNIRENYGESTGSPNISTNNFQVAFRTPDWAHANVPCIRCHAHAGINGETVSTNVN